MSYHSIRLPAEPIRTALLRRPMSAASNPPEGAPAPLRPIAWGLASLIVSPRSGAAVFVAHEACKLGVLQQQNRLRVDDFAARDHRQSLVERRLQNLDILAFMLDAAAVPDLVGRRIFGDEEGELLAKSAGARIPLEQAARMAHSDASLFLRLMDDSRFRVEPLEAAGADLDHAVASLLEIGGQAELAHEDDGRTRRVVE